MDEGGYLPPEPPGPEPELGARPQPPPAPGPQAASQAHPPPQGYQPPPGYGQPPPGAPPQPGTVGPPPYYVPPPGYTYPPPGAYGYYGAHQVPDNGSAVAGFVLSLVAGGLLLISGGLSTVVSLGCAIAGMIYSRKGKRRVDSGETPKHRGLAQAGWIIGIISLVLSLLATAGWILILVLALTDEQFRDDLDRELDDSQSIRAAVSIGAAGLRLAGVA